MLILQAVDEPYMEALKEEYIGYDGILPTTKISGARSAKSPIETKLQ